LSDDLERIKEELEEVRRLKEDLQREVEKVRRDQADVHRQGIETERLGEEAVKHRRERSSRPPRAPRVPRVPRVAGVDIDLEDLTDSLETMMDGLGHQIEMSLKSVDGLKVPGIRVTKGRRRTKAREEQRKEIESIAPERVAQVVSPLGSEERLKILDYLKTGGKSFNDIENFTSKTGSSLTHHLNPLIDAGYVVKGEVRGTYYVTVEGRLAYRLAQWLTHRVEKQRERVGNNSAGEVDIDFDEDDDTDMVEDEDATEEAAEHLERLAEEIEDARDQLEDERDKLEDAREDLEESLEEDDDLDDIDWDD
jgi:DNA-binding transcriptional ArsR family regulator